MNKQIRVSDGMIYVFIYDADDDLHMLKFDIDYYMKNFELPEGTYP